MKILKRITGVIILLAGIIFGIYKLTILTGSLHIVLQGIFVALIITVVISVAVWLLCN